MKRYRLRLIRFKVFKKKKFIIKKSFLKSRKLNYNFYLYFRINRTYVFKRMKSFFLNNISGVVFNGLHYIRCTFKKSKTCFFYNFNNFLFYDKENSFLVFKYTNIFIFFLNNVFKINNNYLKEDFSLVIFYNNITLDVDFGFLKKNNYIYNNYKYFIYIIFYLNLNKIVSLYKLNIYNLIFFN